MPLYALPDSGEGTLIDLSAYGESQAIERATELNSKGYGIFEPVNEFQFGRRIENLMRIRAWYTEIDDGGKDEMIEKINNAPIWPSRVVESKRGFHVYYHTINPTISNYGSVQSRLRHYFGGDDRAKDISRLLRVPGFYHMKDASDPFMVREWYHNSIRYNEAMMLHFFKEPPSIGEEVLPTTAHKIVCDGDDLTEKLNRVDNEEALTCLSGKWCVQYERYSFKTVSRGRRNILVNGKSTSCFIDEHKKIGATHGGPTIWQWLKYFGHEPRTIYQVLKDEVFK